MREDRAAIGVLVLLIVAAFANVVFGGRSLVPSEHWNPLLPVPSERISGPNFVPAEEWRRRNLVSYPNYRDIVAAAAQAEPAHELLRRSLARGEFPFWDPYIGAGNPSFASLVPAYLFPPSLIVTLLGNGSLVRNIYILLLILCSGVCTYFLLRRHDLGSQASLAGAIAFTFSGAVMQMVPSALGQPVAFFSLPLIVTARLLEKPGARRAAELALVFAFVAFASFPPVLMQIFGVCVVYVVVALLRRSSQRAARGSWFAAGAATSLAIGAVVYLPAILAMREATHILASYAHAAAGILHPRQIMQLLSPSIMGGADIYESSPFIGGTGQFLNYAGAVALLLAGCGLLARVSDRAGILKLTAILAGALSLAKIFGVPPVQWIAHVPFLRNIHYSSYFGILVAWTIAILAALGADALRGGRVHRWHVAVCACLLFIALILVRIMAWRWGVHLHPEGWRWIADFRLLVLFSVLAAVLSIVPPATTHRGALATSLLLGVLAIEGITNSAYPRPRRWNVWRHPPRYVEVLMERNSGGRVLPTPFYQPNVASVYRQPTIDSLANFTAPRVFVLYRRYFNPRTMFFQRETKRIPPERILDLANVEYLALSPANTRLLVEAARRSYETVHADEVVQLMRRPVTPRYSFTTEYRVVATATAALEEVAALPPGMALLEKPPSFPSSSRPFAEVRPRVVHFGLNEVEIAVNAPLPGLLVCSESNMNGWQASVDGRPAPILAANFAFRAVEVPAGSHTIRFRYRAPGFTAGLIITLIALAVAVAGLNHRGGSTSTGTVSSSAP